MNINVKGKVRRDERAKKDITMHIVNRIIVFSFVAFCFFYYCFHMIHHLYINGVIVIQLIIC